MKKTYEAYISRHDIDHFCAQLVAHGGTIITFTFTFSKQGDVLYHLRIAAPEGLIDPKWEVKG